MRTLIIAEAGVNHCGNLDTALQLVDAAADAGADIVKFQTFKADKLVSKQAQLADYQKKGVNASSQLEMLRQLELSEADHIAIIDRCRQRGIRFLSTPFDIDSAELLASMGIDLWKVPSGEITNFPLLRRIAQLGGKVILSTGMSTIAEIEEAVDTLVRFGIDRADITLLHCNTEYPTPMADVNLAAMDAIGRYFNLPVGYSDHTIGIEVPIAAVARGASVIEKHFTLDKSMHGPDHKASLVPSELKAMVRAIRNIELAIGSPDKKVTPSEAKNIAVARKSIVAAKPIRKGELISEDNITTKRPGTGISPMRWESIIGTIATRDYQPDDLIQQ